MSKQTSVPVACAATDPAAAIRRGWPSLRGRLPEKIHRPEAASEILEVLRNAEDDRSLGSLGAARCATDVYREDCEIKMFSTCAR